MIENKNDGTFSTSDKEMIDALNAHPKNKTYTMEPFTPEPNQVVYHGTTKIDFSELKLGELSAKQQEEIKKILSQTGGTFLNESEKLILLEVQK